MLDEPVSEVAEHLVQFRYDMYMTLTKYRTVDIDMIFSKYVSKYVKLYILIFFHCNKC